MPKNKSQLQLSWETIKVLMIFASSQDEVTGSQIINRTGTVAGTIYPLLERLRLHGWIKTHTEIGNPRKLGRPLYKFHSLTEKGSEEVEFLFDQLSSKLDGARKGLALKKRRSGSELAQ